MKIKQVIVLSLLCLLPTIFGVAVWDKLPEQLPIHFDLGGTPDSYASKAFVVFGLPSIIGALNLLVYFLRLHDPKKREQTIVFQYLTHCMFPVLSSFCVSLSIFHGLETNLPLTTIMIFFMGLFIAIIGNYMPKFKPNYFMGIKLPWTLNDENNWYYTHRLSGFIWVICGAIICVNSFFNLELIYIIALVLIIGAPLVISFSYYKNKRS